MLVGGLDQVRKRPKQQISQYEYKQRCESLMIQSSNYYATTENSSFKCQEYDKHVSQLNSIIVNRIENFPKQNMSWEITAKNSAH